MGIKEIINRERWELVGGFDFEVRRHNASLDRIEAEVRNLMFPTVRKIWMDDDGSIRIDFIGNWHIAMRDCHLSRLIREATDPLHKRITELETQIPRSVTPCNCECGCVIMMSVDRCPNCGTAITQTAE